MPLEELPLSSYDFPQLPSSVRPLPSLETAGELTLDISYSNLYVAYIIRYFASLRYSIVLLTVLALAVSFIGRM